MTNKIKYVCVHHTAVSRKDQPSQFYPVNRYHKEKWNMISELGWYIGYNYFIGTNGVLTQTRNVGEETMAVVGHNHDTIHICSAGNFLVEQPTDEQDKTLIELIKQIEKEYPGIEIKRHCEMQKGRTCPGFSRSYFDAIILNEVHTTVPDKEDVEKAEQIKQMSSLLDKLREQLLRLLNRI